jgi:hypothetical protein
MLARRSKKAYLFSSGKKKGRLLDRPFGDCEAMLLFLFLPLVLFVEAFNTAGRVDNLLLSGEEGVALVAKFDPEGLPGGARSKGTAARAGHIGIGKILWMNFFFHDYCPG